jgi:hypothetical protein
MASFDYGDPGMDSAYCDGLSEYGVIARCAECHDEFRTVIADIGARCDACWAEHDAHTDALEAAMGLRKMAQAILSLDLTKVKEVA